MPQSPHFLLRDTRSRGTTNTSRLPHRPSPGHVLRRALSALLLGTSLGLAALTGPAVAQSASVPPPDIAARSWFLFDVTTNTVLYSQTPDERVEPASLTKLMTAYVVFEALRDGTLKPDARPPVSNRAYKSAGSRMFVDPRSPATVDELLHGLIIQSGNDAAIILAEAVAGSEAQFVQLMNAEAKRLGMKDTNFENSTGLPSAQHYTSVQDLITLSAAIIHDYPQYYPLYAIQSYSYNNITQPNRNLLLYRDPNVDGLKTGHTNTAGYNLIASSKRNGRRVVSVVVGTESIEARASESSKLLNWALQAFDTPKAYDANTPVSSVKVYKGQEDNVNIGFLEPVYLTIPHGEGNKVKPVLETVQPVLAPIEKGQVLGKLKITYNGQVLAERKVVALTAVDEAGFFGRLWDSIKLWFKNMFADE